MKRLFPLIFLSIFSSHYLLAQAPDWSTSIASIIYTNCSACHHENGIAPFPLMSYDDALLNGYSIQEQVTAHKMPPWPADPSVMHYKDEMVLSQTEIDLINEWVDAGMPSGDLYLAPPPPVFVGGTTILNPDDTIHIPAYTKSIEVDESRAFAIQSGYTEAKYLNQLDFVPSNYPMVHHVMYYHDSTGTSWQIDQDWPGPGWPGFSVELSPFTTIFAGWNPGRPKITLPSFMGFEIPAGSDYVFDFHYGAGNLGEVDSSAFYVKYATDTNVRPIFIDRLLWWNLPSIVDGPLFIPANTVKTFHEKSDSFLTDMSLVGLAPHCHYVCTSWEVYMVSLPADTTYLVVIPEWDFNWQMAYFLTKVMKIPAGSKMWAEATFDNTINNPNNPSDPPQDVSVGDKSTDEMMAVRFWMMEYHPGDEDIILDSSFYIFTGEGIIEQELPVKIYPNPARDQFQINVFLPEHHIHWTITDPLGTIRKTEEKFNVYRGSYEESIDISELNPGVYFFSVQSGDTRAVRKLVVGE